MDERRYCEVCGHDITAYIKTARVCGTKCRQRRTAAQNARRSSEVKRAVYSFQWARDRHARMDPDFTVQRLAKMILARGDCYLCGASLEDEYHVDHIFPIARGGKHEEANIGFLCPTCNVHKGDRTVAGYLQYVAEYDSPRIQRILDRAPLILESVCIT